VGQLTEQLANELIRVPRTAEHPRGFLVRSERRIGRHTLSIRSRSHRIRPLGECAATDGLIDIPGVALYAAAPLSAPVARAAHGDLRLAGGSGGSPIPRGTSSAVAAPDISNEHSHEPHWEVLTVLLTRRIVGGYYTGSRGPSP
jgi:hypothetical protein